MLRPVRGGPRAHRRLRPAGRRGRRRRSARISRGVHLRSADPGGVSGQIQRGTTGPAAPGGERADRPVTAAYTPSELLAVSASRLLADGKVVFAGVGVPLL